MSLSDSVPSAAFDVLQRNAEDLDKLVNGSSVVTNRVGDQLTPVSVLLQGLGYIDKGTFTAGATLTTANDILQSSGEYYRWTGALPKTVTAGSSPTPSGAGGWVSVGDASLRAALAAANSPVLVGGVEAGKIGKAYGETLNIATIAGIDNTGATDMYSLIQAALNSGAKSVYVPKGTYLLSKSLTVPSGVHFYGDGYATTLKMTAAVNPRIIDQTNTTNVLIEKFRIELTVTSGSYRCGVYAWPCQYLTVRDIWVEGNTDSNGVMLFDSDNCLVDRLYFNGGASRNGYAAYIAGCVGTVVQNSIAYQPEFGFVMVGKDILPALTRTSDNTFGNKFANCHVYAHGGHAFDLNSVVGNTVSDCSASDYAGSSTNVAFQNKHPSGANSRQNVFTGCTVKNCPSGFGTQLGSNCVFNACTAIGVTKYGFLINNSNRVVVTGAVIREFGEYGIWMNSSSANCIFSNIVMETSTATATGIGLVSAGVSSNQFDNIRMPSTLAYGIDIASGANNNRFGLGVFVNDNAIRDLSGNTIWPLVVMTPEISLTATGNSTGRYVHRGMVIAAARAVVTVAITGSPQVQMGRVTSNGANVAAQSLANTAAGSINNLTISSPLFDPAGIAQARVSTAGTAGSVVMQFEGLPRL